MKARSMIPQICLSSFDIDKSEVNDADFQDYFNRLLRNKISVALISGGKAENGRYSIIGCDPMAIFRSKGELISIQTSVGTETFTDDPLEALDRFHLESFNTYPLLCKPFCGGTLGYFSYDLKNSIENLPQTVADPENLPDIFQMIPSQVLIHDRQQKTLTKLSFSFCEKGYSNISAKKHHDVPNTSSQLKSDFCHEEYLETVEKIREYIRQGDVYQVNLSQRFSTDFPGNPVELLIDLFKLNPASYFAYVNAGDHQIISTSPERFLNRCGGYIESRPIKGTRKRGASPAEDEALKEELLSSTKDDAELSMIVDLIRNDLGKVCKPGSVVVTSHKNIEAYQNVYHLDSTVTGSLRDDISISEIINATFPGGSITGCPKIRSMEIIDELEKHVRHVYTGAIGYLGWHKNIDLNIAIRTALICNSKLSLNSGGGIVYDSDAEMEYQETLHKAKTFFDIISSGKGKK